MGTVEDAQYVHEIVSEDIIDSRDLIALRETVRTWLETPDHDEDAYDEDEAQAIIAAVDAFESADVADWEYGEAFIRESYFTEYAEDLAEDIGAISREYQWPLSHIDWDEAAEALKQDYTAVEVNGVTYYAR